MWTNYFVFDLSRLYKSTDNPFVVSVNISFGAYF
jgi:hypothetical protein